MMLFAIVIAFFAVVCPLGLLPLLFSQSLYCRDREENCFVVYNASAYKPEIVVKKGKYRVRIYRRFLALVKLVTLAAYLVDKICFTLNCLFYKIYYKLYYKFIFRNPSLEQQSEVSGLQQMVNNIFSEVGLDSTKLILFSNTFVTIISLSIELFKKGYANTSKYILIPLATSVISLASIVISSENIQVSEVSISAIINFITGKSETTIPTNDIDAANKAIAKDNMCKQIKKKTFAVFKTGPEDWPVEYIKQLAFDHTWELVAKIYKLNDEQVKMLQERVAESVPPAEPQPSTSGTSPTFGPVFSTPDEMAQHYRKQLKTLDLATPKKIQPENRILKWRISSLKHLKENFTPEQMQLRFNLNATEIDFVKEYDVSQIQPNDKFFAEDVKALNGNVKLEKQALYGNYIKIIIGVIGFALSPIIAFIMEKYSKLSGVTEIAKVVQSTKYLNEQVQSSADFILNLFNISPETFSIEYHIAEKCKELNLFIQTPIHNLLEEPILLADFQSKIYETEAFLRKIPYDNTSMGLRGLHTAASSHLAAIKRTGQLTGFRQEPRLILFMGSAGTGKTRLAKKLAQTLGEKLYPNIDPLRRVLEITASNNYWPGISGQPIGLLDECDAKKCEDSLLFKNLKGLCSTAVFNCEGAAIEHKHQPAPFKILIGTTNMGIADLRSMLHEHYGDHSMNALWSRMLIYQVERNVQEFGELNILNREASRFDTTGKFRHSIIKECSWSDQYQCPTPSREILLEEMVEIVKNRIQFLEEQYKKTQLTAQSNGGKMSICVTGPSGVGKTEYFVKSHFMDYFSARFNLGDKKQPKIIVHDDSHQRGKFNESEYLETYENAPPGSVFLNIENFGSLPLTYSTVLSYLSFKIYPLYKTSMEAIPRRYGVYPARFSGLLSYFVWFGRTTSWINPYLEISYIFVCSLVIQFICLFSSLNLQLVILCINILANVVTYFSLKFYPISICADVVDTDNLTSYFSDIYISNVVSSNKLNILNSIPPQITPNVEVILDCVSNISDFAPSNVMNFLYQNRTNFLVASGNRIYIEPSIALKMVKYIGELKFMKLAESQASHFKILNQFYRICKASGICVNLVVTLGNKKYSIFGNDLYVADDVVDNSCITTEGLIFEGVPLTWKDIASVQVGSTTLQEVTNSSDLDYVKLKRLVLSISNEQVNEIKTSYYEAQVTHMKQVSTAMWNEFMDFFKNTITGKIVAGLIVVLAAYGIGKCLFGESKQPVNKQGKRKIGSRKKKTNYETDQERQNRELSATSSETDSDGEDTPKQQGNKRGAKKKTKPRGFESDDYTRRSPQTLSKNENLSSQVKVSRQGVENIPDLNGMTGIGPAQQVAEKCMKNLVQIYAIPTHMSDQIVQSLTPDEINTFTRNYAMVIKDDILATVGHMGEIAKHGFNHYIMCDELTSGVKYGKCEILKLYKNRDLALMQCPAIKGKFKSIYSKLSRTFYTAPSDGNVLFARYGPMNQKGTKNKEFHSAYMTLFTDETKIEDATGETLIISKFIYNYFGLTDTVFTFSGDCGLPYIYKHGSEYKMIGIHAMATTSPGSYVSVASCIFQEDIDEVSPSPQSTQKECPGCLSDKMRWVKPTKKKDTAEHDLLWNSSCGSSKNNFISFLQDIEKYCTENKYEYNTYIGKSCKGTVPDHLHVHRYTLDKMKERRTRALEDDWFSLSFDNYFHLVHYITHQMTWAEEFRIVFSFLPNGKVYTEFHLYEYSVDMAISPKKNLQQSKFGWQSFEMNIPKISKGIWNFTEGGTFMSNLWNVESPRVTPLCKVPSQSYKSFKTKYVKTPYSRFVSLENRKKPFNPNCQEPHPLKLVSRQGKFNPFLIHLKDITPSPNMAEVDLKVVAYKNLFREKFQMYRNLRKVSDEEVLYGIDKQSDLTDVMSRLEVNTSAGYSLQRNYKVIQKKDVLSVDENGIYKWEDNEASRDLQESYGEAKLLIESGTPVFTIFMDTLKDEKLKIQKTYKGRQFSAADFLLILLERKYLGQFLAKAVKYDKEVAVGMDPILDFHELFCRMAKFPNHFTVDFVSWDKKIPAAAYRIFFDLLCDINPQYKKVLSAFSQMYQHTFHVMDDILYAVNGTMASGCVATAPLNSVLNNFLMMIAYIYLCEENNVEPSVKHFNDHIEQISYGDDKWISTDLDWFNMVTVSRIFKEKFGMEMGSSEKGEELTPFVPLDQISFISRYPRKLPSGVYSGALKKITIETFFHWTTSTTKEHLGLLLSLASFESCLWEPEYYSAITKEIENLLSKFKYLRSYVYIYDREVVADSVMDMGFIRFLCQLGLSGLIEINTTHRMLRYCHKQTKLIWKNNHITGKFMKMSANVKSYENDLVWLNEWAQKRRMLLKWSHCRLSNETVVDLAICEGAWEKDFGEVLYTFQSRGQNLNIAKYNCAAVARKILEPKLEEAKMQLQTKIVTPSWCIPLHPHFSSYEARLASFKNWPLEYCQDPAALAEAGFYYTGLLDRVLCFHCDGGLSDWKRTDDPRIEHAKHFDRCYFVKINNFRSLYEKELQDKSWDEEDSVEELMDIDPDEVPMDIDSEETLVETEVDEVDSSIEVSIKVKDFMSQIFMSTKHKLAKQSDVPAINVTSGNTVPVAQVTSLEPSMAAGNTFYSNTRIGTAVENLNPTALALNNPAGTGSSFDIKESVYSLYKPWISTSVNGSQAVGTEVFRLSLDPQKLPTSILNYVNMHENIIPALDIGIFVNGTAGGLGSLVLGWVPDAADGKTYALEDLWRVSCKAISLASTTATTEVLSDIRRMGLYRKVTGDSEPFPGIIGMIDMPATNVNRNDLVNFYIRVMVKLNPQCLLMSPIVTKPTSLATQLYSDIPLNAFIKEGIIDLTVTGPARLEQALETTTYADGGWNTGKFSPLPIQDDSRQNLIWAVGSSHDVDPEAYPVFVDPTLTDSMVKKTLSTTASYPAGSSAVNITKGMPIYDKIYIAYGTVPTPSGKINREVPGTKTKISPIYGYALYRDWLSFTCNYIYVQEGGVGVIAEFTLDGELSTIVDQGIKWSVFRLAKRLAQSNPTRGDLVFYGNFTNKKNHPTSGCIARNIENFAIMQSSLPVSSSTSQDANAQGVISAWPCEPNVVTGTGTVLGPAYGFVFYKGEDLAMDTESMRRSPSPQTSILQLSKTFNLNYFVAETSTGNQIALPSAMNALTFSKQGFTMLPTNRSAGVQPPSAAGYANLLQFLETMREHLGKPAIAFGLKYGKTQVELQACYANGVIMTRGASNVQRYALPVNDCYISNMMPIADPIDIIPLATNISSWKPIALQVSQQMWGTAALGIGQGLSTIGSALYANSARDFNAQLLEKLQEMKNKNMLDLEKLKYENQLALYGQGSGSAQSSSRFAQVPPPVSYPAIQPKDNLIDFVRPTGTNPNAPEFVPQINQIAEEKPQEPVPEQPGPSTASSLITSSPKEMFNKYMNKMNM